MYRALSSRWLRLIVGTAFCAVALVVFAQASAKENLRAELIRLQKQSGLSLVSFGGGGGNLYVVLFTSRHLAEKQFLKGENVGDGSVSSDGRAIAFELRRKTGQTFSTPTGKEFPKWRTYLGIIRQDGSDLREYPDLEEPYDPCWSLDGSALALSAKNLKQGKEAAEGLQILNLGDGATEGVDAKGYVTSQCWSPNG